MKTYRDGSAVTVEIPFQDMAGNEVVPATLSYRVYDEAGVEIIGDTAHAFSAGETTTLITIPGGNNALTTEDRVMRIVELTMTDADGGVFINLSRYIVERVEFLGVMSNSYLTYDSAVLYAMNVADMRSWDKATEAQRKGALVEAYRNLGKMRYSVLGVDYSDITDQDAATFEAMNSGFLIAIKTAQVVEADSLLGGNVVQDRRENGLLSNSVGESSQMYRTGKPLLLPVSRRALSHLAGYLRYGSPVGRSS